MFYTKFDGSYTMMVVQIDLETGVPGTPRVLFESQHEFGQAYRKYDVTPDGQRFLTIKPDPNAERREVIVVLNWFEELKRIVPSGRR